MSLLVGRDAESSDMQAAMSSATQAGHSSGTLQPDGHLAHPSPFSPMITGTRIKCKSRIFASIKQLRMLIGMPGMCL